MMSLDPTPPEELELFEMLKPYLVDGDLRLDFGRDMPEQEAREHVELAVARLRGLGYDPEVLGPADGIYRIRVENEEAWKHDA
jgi:hypothetical protein